MNKAFLLYFITALMIVGLGAQEGRAANITTWKQAKSELQDVKADYLKLSQNEKKRTELFHRIHDLFGASKSLRLSPQEERERIELVVSVIGTVIKDDYANSTTDATYFDYKARKKEYLDAISKLPKDQRKRVIESYKVWERFESRINDPEIVGSPKKSKK